MGIEIDFMNKGSTITLVITLAILAVGGAGAYIYRDNIQNLLPHSNSTNQPSPNDTHITVFPFLLSIEAIPNNPYFHNPLLINFSVLNFGNQSINVAFNVSGDISTFSTLSTQSVTLESLLNTSPPVNASNFSEILSKGYNVTLTLNIPVDQQKLYQGSFNVLYQNQIIASSSISLDVFNQTPATSCFDGTPVNHCSSTRPEYCSADGLLVNNCSVCGCSSGLTCQNNESCAYYNTHSFVYVTNSFDQSVSVINISTNTVTATIPIENGSELWSISTTPNGQYALVVNGYPGKILVIDTASNSITKTITIGGEPFGLAITPDGKYAYVTSQGSTGWIIDLSNFTVIQNLASLGYGRGITISPDGKFAYVAYPGQYPNGRYGGLEIINITTNTYSGIINDIFGATHLTISPDGRYAIVNNISWNGSAYPASTVAINLSTNATIKVIPTGVGTVNPGGAISPYGKYAYASESGNVIVINTTDFSVIQSIPVLNTSQSCTSFPCTLEGIAITPDGKFVYAVNWGQQSVSVIDTSTNSIIKTIQVGQGPEAVAIQ